MNEKSKLDQLWDKHCGIKTMLGAALLGYIIALVL